MSTLRDLRQKRERSEDWIGYAGWTAIGTAVLTGTLIIAPALDHPSLFPARLPLLTTVLGQALVGYKLLRERSQWAAWGLIAISVVSFVLDSMARGLLSGIVWKVVVGYVYVRGFLAALDYHELTKQIDAAVATEVPSDAA
jgi:hypothetical protein